jgi:hypothetical protein
MAVNKRPLLAIDADARLKRNREACLIGMEHVEHLFHKHVIFVTDSIQLFRTSLSPLRFQFDVAVPQRSAMIHACICRGWSHVGYLERINPLLSSEIPLETQSIPASREAEKIPAVLGVRH